jgi:hypothetical protein
MRTAATPHCTQESAGGPLDLSPDGDAGDLARRDDAGKNPRDANVAPAAHAPSERRIEHFRRLLKLFRHDSISIEITFWNLAAKLAEDRKGRNATYLGGNLPAQRPPQLHKIDCAGRRQHLANPTSQSIRPFFVEPEPAILAR